MTYNQNANLIDGSKNVDYLPYLQDNRATWQRSYETEIGTVIQNDFEQITNYYTIDLTSIANRDIEVGSN